MQHADELRVCFLDVDGVLARTGHVELQKVLLLQIMVRRTGAKIVLSSNWRNHPQLKDELIQVLVGFGIEYIGDTPYCGPDSKLLRPVEILSWLHAWSLTPNRPAVKQYVVVDDRYLASEVGGDELQGEFGVAYRCVHVPATSIRKAECSILTCAQVISYAQIQKRDLIPKQYNR